MNATRKTRPAFLLVAQNDGVPSVGTFYSREEADVALKSYGPGAVVLPLSVALAAPALLSACEAALSDAYDLMPDEDEDPVASLLISAVRKAKGE